MVGWPRNKHGFYCPDPGPILWVGPLLLLLFDRQDPPIRGDGRRVYFGREAFFFFSGDQDD